MAVVFTISLRDDAEYPRDAEGNVQQVNSVGFSQGDIDFSESSSVTTTDNALADNASQHPWLQVDPKEVDEENPSVDIPAREEQVTGVAQQEQQPAQDIDPRSRNEGTPETVSDETQARYNEGTTDL